MATATIKTRDERVAAYNAERKILEAARGRGDKKTTAVSGAKLANRSREIREAELELALAGTAFTPWEPPKVSRTRKVQMTQAELEAKLAPLAKVFKDSPFESVKHSADIRITALLKAGKDRGFTIKDPRKS